MSPTPPGQTGSSEPSNHPAPQPGDIAAEFVFDYVGFDESLDDADISSGRRWSTWLSVEPLCRGPEPSPDWVVTSQAAIDTDLGILKTGKEADAFLLERAVPDSEMIGESVVMVAKRYRDPEHSSFHRADTYTAGRRVRNTRDMRAMTRKTDYGRSVAAGQWAAAEWSALVRLTQMGLPVPYPVQIDGTEILMEHITTADGSTAPRLAQTRPGPELLASYFEQLRSAMTTLAEAGLVHGDLSPYNILAADERVVIIDVPQMVDLIANPTGFDFLHRDCVNVCRWFNARGLEVDPDGLFADLI